MKIVVLDGHALNPGDLSWDRISKFGDFEYYDRTEQSQIVARAKSADILINNKVELTCDIMRQLPNLKYIGLMSTGYNVVDIEYAKAHGIVVCNIPAYSAQSVAQLTMAMILEVAMGVGLHSKAVKDGEWSKRPDFCFWLQDIVELDGKTIGLIGYGANGQATAKLARAFGMRVLAHTRSGKSDGNAESVSLDELLQQSDIISLHCPQNDQTKGMINADTISKMKDGVVVVNTARGGIVNEADVAEALERGKIHFYCADVLASEPPSQDNLLLNSQNTYITPHIAWASVSARNRLMDIASKNIRSFLNGKVVNNVY